MKKVFTLIALSASIILSAQEAGKVGELLKNEATKYDMQIQSTGLSDKSSFSTSKYDDAKGNSTRSSSRTTSYERKNSPKYTWQQNYGYAEVFLRIPEGGYYTVEIDNQVISNGTGKFRFFDLQAGHMNISIYEQGYLRYRSQLHVRQNNRLILDYFSGYGLYLIDSYGIRGLQFDFNQWDDLWNNPYLTNPGYPGQGQISQTMDAVSFDNFVETMVDRATFDREKLEYIEQQATLTLFTAQQIKTLLATLSFDDQKVAAGKLLFPRCIDKANFYQVYDSIDFESSRRKLREYIDSIK